MNDFKYDRVRTPAAMDSERATLAAKMSAFEKARGPVETAPIRVGEPPKPAFIIRDPDKPKIKARMPAHGSRPKPASAVSPEVAEARRAARERDKRTVRAVWS